MSIVKMKRIRLVGLLSERESIIHQLLLQKCVEISDLPKSVGEENLPVLANSVETSLAQLRSRQNQVLAAIDVLDKYAPKKTGLFPVRKDITVSDLFTGGNLAEAEKTAGELIEMEREITRLHSNVSHLESEHESLLLWEGLDVPLSLKGTKETKVFMGSFPAGVEKSEIEGNLSQSVPLSYIQWAGKSREQQCAMIISHKTVFEETLDTVRSLGFTQSSIDSADGTALVRRSELANEIDALKQKIMQLKTDVYVYSDKRDNLKLCYDRLEQEISKEEAKEKLVVSGRIFALEGWVSAPEEDGVRKELSGFTCAYELSEPQDDDNVPVKLKNNSVTRPMNMVTEMYSLPQYKGIDPNGLMWPFFIAFFGIMYADLGYGLVLIAISLISRRWKPRGTVKYMMDLMFQAGISTAVFGFLLGGFFGDLVPVFSETFLSKRIDLWAIINPLEDPMTIMVIALALGAVQIIVGMAVKVYLCFRDGHPLDAFLDVGTWWLLFFGIAWWVLGHGYWVAIAGVISLVLTQGRSSPTIIGKLIGGISSLYDITAYLSDVLSYIRLMALLLATSVIGSVVNLLASMPGNIFAFIIIFILGHALNMGINIVGTYVHTIRLQYLEFFNRFYEEGGKPFKPLKINTKYHDIIDN